MRDNNNPVRVRVCFACKQYTMIFPNNASNRRFVSNFNIWHNKHTTQTININELDNSYTCITDRKREKIHEGLIKERIESIIGSYNRELNEYGF